MDAVMCCPDPHLPSPLSDQGTIPPDAVRVSCYSSLSDPIASWCRTEVLSLAKSTPELLVGLAKASVANSSQLYPFWPVVSLNPLQGLFSRVLSSSLPSRKSLPRICFLGNQFKTMFNKYLLNKWMKGLFHCKLWGSSSWAEITVQKSPLTFICIFNILFCHLRP